MLRLSRLWIVGWLLLLGACSSTTFVYNRLDFLLPWYVTDYVDLAQEQESYLDELLSPFLAWHRGEELPLYLEILDGIEARLDQPLTSGIVAEIAAEFEAAWWRLEDESLDWLLDLGSQLSDEQIAGFIEVLWEKQEEYEKEYIGRTDAEFHQDSYDNLLDSVQDYLGVLSTEQREKLREFSNRLLRSDRAWLQDREEWLKELTVMLERKPQWQQRIRAAVIARRENISPGLRRVYEHNMNIIFAAIAELVNSRSEGQDSHLRTKLSQLCEDLDTLIAQGEGSASSDSD